MSTSEQRNAPQDAKPNEDRGPATRRRGDFGVSAAERLHALEDDVEVARREAEANPEKAQDLRIAEKRLDLFVYAHDNAGAFKFKTFGREMMGMFTPDENGERKIDIDPATGEMRLAESERNRRVMFVNMGELDRVNKEGGHTGGNKALAEAVHAIEDAVRARIGTREGKKAGYSILRYKGNEFMVSLDDVDEADFAQIMKDVQAAKPIVDGMTEHAPLVANGFTMEDALAIVNQLQSELPDGERLDVSSPGAAAREVIEVMRRSADWSLDVDKFLSRVDRVQQKAAAARDGALPQEDAKAFFDNYMEKMFRGTPLASLEALANVSAEDARKYALAYAGKDLQAANGKEAARRAIIDQRLAEIRQRRGTKSMFMLPPPMRAPGAAPLAQVPRRTRGQLEIDRVSAHIEAVENAGTETDRIEADLDMQIEKARRDMGTGLLERGVHYEDLEQSFKEGRETSMVFVDMGFLRYFDNKGGTDVGDNALKVAADVMERAIEKSGVDAKAYRYGGDEFTIQIAGGEANVAKFNAALAAERAAAGAIPTGKRGSADGYVPTELVFNQGVSDSAMAEEVYASLAEAGQYSAEELADPDEVANAKAELMFVIADRAIDAEKAVARFVMLAEALRDPDYANDSLRKTQVDNLVSFSNKALYAELGGGDFLKALATSGKDAEAMRVEAAAWVEGKKKAAAEKENRKPELLAQLIELHGKIRFYKRELDEAKHKTDEERDKNAKLLAELERVRGEKDQLIAARKALGQ